MTKIAKINYDSDLITFTDDGWNLLKLHLFYKYTQLLNLLARKTTTLLIEY